jgi:hypothetical protein
VLSCWSYENPSSTAAQNSFIAEPEQVYRLQIDSMKDGQFRVMKPYRSKESSVFVKLTHLSILEFLDDWFLIIV